MTVDDMLARARPEILRVAPGVLARGSGHAALVSLDAAGVPHVGAFSVASIVGMMGLDGDAARRIVARESTPLPPGEIRVIVIGRGSPVVIVFALESGEVVKAA